MSRRVRERMLSRARAARVGRLGAARAGGEASLGALGQSVESAARFMGGATLVYLLVMAYLAITAFGVTHRELFLETPVRLPLLGAEMPLAAFFTLAPIAILILHAFVLARAVLLSAKLGRYNAMLAERFPHMGAAEETARLGLPSNGLVQVLAGPAELRSGGLGTLLKAIVFCVLVLVPVLLLFLLLVRFLPYHDEAITWLLRFAILADVLLLWVMWPAILAQKPTLARPSFERHGGFVLAGLVPIGLAFTAATFPGESLDELIGKRQWIPPSPLTASIAARDEAGEPGWTSLHDLLFHGEIDAASRRRKSPFSNTLVLPGFRTAGSAAAADPSGRDAAGPAIGLRGRRFEGAVLIAADLRKADLSGAALEAALLDRADLSGAILEDARLDRARMNETVLRGAVLNMAQLRGAWLEGAQLQGASLGDALLQGARLREAQLQDAALTNAQLQGAMLPEARLGGATLSYAQLQHAKLDGAELQNATLDHAQAQGASLRSAQLQGASLFTAQLQGAFLDRAELQGASLLGINLKGAVLARAGLQGAVLKDAELQGASLDQAQLQGATLDYAQLQGANLLGAQLQGATFRGARLVGTSLENANIWRATFDGAMVQAVFEEGVQNGPSPREGEGQASGKSAFAALKALIAHEIPRGQKREDVLKRIALLDPDANVPETSRSTALESGRVDKAAYQKVMADTLVSLVCSGGDFDREVVLGLVGGNRIRDAGPYATDIAHAILEPSCPVLATLSESDRAALRNLTTEAVAPSSDPAPSPERQGSAAPR